MAYPKYFEMSVEEIKLLSCFAALCFFAAVQVHFNQMDIYILELIKIQFYLALAM